MATIKGPIQLAGKSAAAWVSQNATLRDRQFGFETDTGKAKFGDGVTPWNSLGYFSFWSEWGRITGTLADQSDLATALGGKETSIATGTSVQYWRGDKTWQTLDKSAVGLGNVNNTSDANKPVSTAQQAALDLKAPLASPPLTGTPTSPTASLGTNTTQIATTAFVQGLVAQATTGLLDLKGDIDCSANPNYPAASKGDAYVVSVAGKIGGASGLSVDVGDTIIAKVDNAGGTQASVGSSWWSQEHNLAGALLSANNLSDLASASSARTNLGLGSIATQNANAVTITGGSVAGVTSVSITPTSTPLSAATATQIAIGESSGASGYKMFLGYGVIGGVYYTGFINALENGVGGHLSINPSGGYVGIGNTQPLSPLDVTGEARVDSLRIDQAATAGTFTATHYLTISLNGTTYRIPCAV